jgi:hypothetical protein
MLRVIAGLAGPHENATNGRSKRENRHSPNKCGQPIATTWSTVERRLGDRSRTAKAVNRND